MSLMRYYKSIPQTEDATHASCDNELQGSNTWPSINLIRSGLALVFILTVFDIICFLYLAVSPSTTFKLQARTPAEDIPFLSTYARLDNVYSGISNSQSTSRSSIINTPRALTHVDSSRPDYIEPLWPKRHATEGGMVPFDERHVTVTDTTSTIAEYHVMDYGMENCTVVLTFPSSKLKADQKTLTQNVTLDVWVLEPARSIDFTRLNWNSKPARKLHVGTFVPIINSTQQTTGYSCKTGTRQIIEIACGRGHCKVHIPAGGHNSIGLYVQQYQTI